MNCKFIPGLCVVMLSSVLSACSTVNSGVGGYLELDTDLDLTFEVEADINPDDSNKPSPVYLRLYELKSTKMFNKADFISLFEKDAEVLGADLIAVQKIKPIKPGENRVDSFVLDNKTAYVALYAEFLKYNKSEFRVVIPITATNVVSTSTKIRISGNQLKIIDGSGFDGVKEDEEKAGNPSLDKAKSGAKKTKGAVDKGTNAAKKVDDIF